MHIKQKQIATTFSLLLSINVLAETLNAGSIEQDVKVSQPIIIKKIQEIKSQINQKQDEEDETPLEINNIIFKGNTLFSSSRLLAEIGNIKGNINTFGQLRAVMNQVTDFYNKEGYPIVLTFLPPQKIMNGEVIIQIVEGVIGDIIIDNSSRLNNSVIKGYLQGNELQKPLYQPNAERSLLLMKDRAGTDYIAYQLAPGENYGETNLGVLLNPAQLLNGSITVDNYGSKSTGRWRTRGTVGINSPFGYGEKITLQGMSSFKGVDYGYAGIELPIGYQGLVLNTSFAHTHYDLGGAFKALDATGTASTFDFSLRYPLIRSNMKNLWISSGGEIRRLRDEIRAVQTVTNKKLSAGHLGVLGSLETDNSFTSFGINNTFGHLNIKSSDSKQLDAESAKTDGYYYKLNLDVRRTQYLTDKWSLSIGLNTQWANKNLDTAEQLSIGGTEAVRGYRSSTLYFDRGLIGQLELAYRLNNYLSLSGFYDVGTGKTRAKPYTNDKNRYSLQSLGVGITSQYKGFFVQTKAAWNTKHNKALLAEKSQQLWLRTGYMF